MTKGDHKGNNNPGGNDLLQSDSSCSSKNWLNSRRILNELWSRMTTEDFGLK